MDTAKFFKKLDTMEKQIKEGVQDVIRDTVFEVQTSLLEPKAMGGTPKITGFLRNNWFISLDSPNSSVTGSKENPGPALSKQNNAMDRFLTANLSVHDKIYINNSVPYGEEINYGTKGRSAQKFRELAIQRGDIVLSKSKVIK